MKLDDVLAMAGEHPLSGFDWGTSVVILYNGLVPTENHIVVSNTGRQAYEKLRRLPTATLMAVLTREVQIVGSSVDFIGTVCEQANNVPPTIPQGQRGMSPMAMIMMVTMVVISLAMVFGTLRSSDKPMNVEALQAVLSTMTELLKEDNRANEATQAKPEEVPLPEPHP